MTSSATDLGSDTGDSAAGDAKAATPKAELERQIMSSCVPKNEREWWAQGEIERLRAEVEKLSGYEWQTARKIVAAAFDRAPAVTDQTEPGCSTPMKQE